MLNLLYDISIYGHKIHGILGYERPVPERKCGAVKESSSMKRRGFLTSSAEVGLTGAMGLKALAVQAAESSRVLKFVPHADLAVLDPVFRLGRSAGLSSANKSYSASSA